MKKIICLVIITSILSGCLRVKPVDQLNILKVIAFDRKEGQFVGTALYPRYTLDEKQYKAAFLKAEASTAGLLLSKMNRQTSGPVEIGKLRMLVFGEELAKEGVSDLVRTICRDPLVGSNMQLAVAEHSAEELLKEAKKEGALFLSDLVEQNIKKDNLPLTNLQVFLFDYYGEGRDAYLPYLKVGEENSIIIDGIGILKNEKLKLHLNEKDTFTFKLLSGQNMNGNIEFPLKKENKKGYIVLTHLYGDMNMNVSNLDSIPKVTVSITMNGQIKDYPSWLNLKDTQNIKFLSREIERKQEKEVYQLLKKLQDHEVDPLGIGDFIRGKQRDWNEKEFYKIYPSIKFRVETKLNLLQSGIGE